MKKIFISLALSAAMLVAFVSCHNNSVYQVTVEKVAGNGDAPVTWNVGDLLVTWDEALAPDQIPLSGLVPDSSHATLQLPDTMATHGVRHFVYPASFWGGEGSIMIPAVQNGISFPEGMPFYAQTQNGSPDLAFKALCGIVRLRIQTSEKIMSVSVTTDDSVHFLSGRFTVDNPTSPVLTPVEGAAKYVSLEQIPAMDFSQGADLYLYVAPGCYNTFTITMVSDDGRVCVKNLKEGKYIAVDRNTVFSIFLGTEGTELQFV